MARTTLTAVPATRSSLPLLKIRRRLVVGFLALAVLAGFGSMFAWLTSDHSTPTPPTPVDQGAVALAQTVVTDYLAARPSSVPAVDGVDNDFSAINIPGGNKPSAVTADSITFAGATPAILGDGQSGARSVEQTVQEKFDVSLHGAMYAVTVTMVQHNGNWLLGADPSITPETLPATGSSTGLNYTDLYKSAGDATLFPDVNTYTARIKQWATTFAKAGHADAGLYALTGDTSARTYSGLGGWSVAADPAIESVVPVSSPVPGFIVRVSLVLAPPAANGSTLKTDYDLYLESDKSQQQPPVVAWGPAGSYRTLNPFINADQ